MSTKQHTGIKGLLEAHGVDMEGKTVLVDGEPVEEPEAKPEPFEVGTKAKVIKVNDPQGWPEFVPFIGRTGEVTHNANTIVLKFEEEGEWGFLPDELEAVES